MSTTSNTVVAHEFIPIIGDPHYCDTCGFAFDQQLHTLTPLTPEGAAGVHVDGHVYWPGDARPSRDTRPLAERNAEIAWELQAARAMVLAGNSETAIAERLDRALELLERQEP